MDSIDKLIDNYTGCYNQIKGYKKLTMNKNYGNKHKPVLQERLSTRGSPGNEKRTSPYYKATQITQKSELGSHQSYLQAKHDQRRSSADEIMKLTPQDQNMLVLPRVRLQQKVGSIEINAKQRLNLKRDSSKVGLEAPRPIKIQESVLKEYANSMQRHERRQITALMVNDISRRKRIMNNHRLDQIEGQMVQR